MPRLSIVALRVLGGLKCSYPPSATGVMAPADLETPGVCPEEGKALPGRLITIEGIEGAGKTTLTTKLAKYLSLRGCDVVVTQEPGGDPVANSIRKLVLDAGQHISDRAELLLFEAARAQHVDTKIIPALEKGAVVLSDRYSDSSVAYQGCARGLEPEAVGILNDFATHCLKPDLTILLDVPADAGLAREQDSDRMSSQGLEFHEQVRNAYLALAEQERERFVVIDATLSVEEVTARAIQAVEKLLPPTGCETATE